MVGMGLMRALRTPLALAAICIAASACGGSKGVSSVMTPVTTTANGAQIFRPGGADYRITVPADWKTVDRRALAGGEAAFAKANPDLAKATGPVMNKVAQTGNFVAYDLTDAGKREASTTGLVSNVLMLRVDTHSSGLDDDIRQEAANEIEDSVKSLRLGVLRSDDAAMGPLTASTVEYVFDIKTKAGTQKVTERDYVAVRNGVVYRLACTSSKARFDSFKASCDQIAGSLEFL